MSIGRSDPDFLPSTVANLRDTKVPEIVGCEMRQYVGGNAMLREELEAEAQSA
jgi:hypothetical protein